MKTLYLSDLDGTLLRNDQKISAESCRIINSLVKKGMHFSYATARSLNTASKAAAGLDTCFPLIIYNGSFVVDNTSHQRLLSRVFSMPQAENILAVLDKLEISPIIYTLLNGEEKFFFDPERLSAPALDFVRTRKDDPRSTPLPDCGLPQGDVFYFTCIQAAPDRLKTAYDLLKNDFNCLFQQDIYSTDHWLEIQPENVSKADAALSVKELLGCDKMIAFGDSINDLALFEAADECYAVANADERLKAAASGIIGSNENDSVAHWLLKNAV